MRPQKDFFSSYAREQIIEALLSLMERCSFHEITVLMITQEAGVARRTFYLYYETKADVLNDYYEVLTREYDAGLAGEDRAAAGSLRAQAEYFFRFWLGHREYLELLYRQGLFHMLMRSFNNYLIRTPEAAAADRLAAQHAAFYAGGMRALLYTWTSGGFRETPEELADVAGTYR